MVPKRKLSLSIPATVRFIPTRGRTAQTWHERTYKLGRPNSLLARGRVIFVTFATHNPLFDAFLLDVPDDANQLFRVPWVIQLTTRPNATPRDSRRFGT